MVVKTKKLKPPATFVKERKDLISRLLTKKDTPIEWPVELSISKRFFKKYPNPKFWESFNIPFEIGSLRVLYSDWGKDFLQKAWNLFCHIENSKSVKLELGDKIGDNIEIKPAPKTINDFLKA